MLTITDMTFRIGGRVLMEKASVTVNDKAKIGLVGRNGTGKSTLFKLINGELSSESGTISLPKGLRIGGVAQEVPSGSQSLIDVVLSADEERANLLKQADTELDPNKIASIHARLADIEAHSAKSRAATILHGLGFDDAAQKRSCSDFSGGWRMRVALAAVLFSKPDLLLLDEPTNYLDLEGSVWLESYLARYPYTTIIISHDRTLLNAAVSQILHLDQLRLSLYRGSYDQFERQRSEKLVLQAKQKTKREAQRKHMEAFVERFRYKASKARQAQSRLKALQRLAPVGDLEETGITQISLPEPESVLSPPILTLEGISAGYTENQPVLSGMNLRIDQDDRIALVGANGNGKSTLAKILSRRLAPQSGSIHFAPKLTVAYFAQHQLDELIPEQSAFNHVRSRMDGVPEAKVRARIAAMGLSASRMDIAVRNLSGGEKARLLLGLATLNGPHLLILDEPTNHLDIDSRASLISALNGYSGAVILISHDQHLIETTADRLWLVEAGSVTPFDGDINDYHRHVIEGSSKSNSQSTKSTNSSVPGQSAKARRREAAKQRATVADLAKEIKMLESDITRKRSEIAKIDNRLEDGSLFINNPDEASNLSKQRTELLRSIDKTEANWIDRNEALETATATVGHP